MATMQSAARKAESAPTFIIVAVVLFVLGAIQLFGLFPLNDSKFSFFLVSLFVAVMLLPLLKYLKFFDVVELRREYKQLQKMARR